MEGEKDAIPDALALADNDDKNKNKNKNIIPNILQLCHKAHKTIEFLAVDDLCKKANILAWIDGARKKIYNNVFVSDVSLQLFHEFGAKMKKPAQLQQVSFCGMTQGEEGGISITALIYNLILWSCFNEDCKDNIVRCLEDRQEEAVANKHQPNKKEHLEWIAALVLSVQVTVRYACQRVCLQTKKMMIEWDDDDGDLSIVKEPVLLEACYLSYVVSSSFSPAFSSFIDMNSKMKGCGDDVHVISFVKMFAKYLRLVKPDAPIRKPLTRMFHVVKMDQSKMCIDSFLAAYRGTIKHKARAKIIQQQRQQQQCDNEKTFDLNPNLRLQLLEMLKLNEIKALRKVVVRVQGGEIEVQQTENTAKTALWSIGLGSDSINSELDQNLCATCLTILTMFVHELVGPISNSNTNSDHKDKTVGKKILVKFLAAAFEKEKGTNSKSKTENKNKGKGIRNKIKNALWMLIKDSSPLFSALFITEVIKGSFFIPTDDVWKVHFPTVFNTVTVKTGNSLEKQTADKDAMKKKESQRQTKKQNTVKKVMFDVDVEKNQLKKGGKRTRTMEKAKVKGKRYSYGKKNIYSTSNSQKVEVAKAKDAERRKNGKKQQQQEQNSATSSSSIGVSVSNAQAGAGAGVRAVAGAGEGGNKAKAKGKRGDIRNSLDRKEQAGALALGKQNKQRRQLQQQKQKPGAVAAAAAVAVEVEGVASKKKQRLEVSVGLDLEHRASLGLDVDTDVLPLPLPFPTTTTPTTPTSNANNDKVEVQTWKCKGEGGMKLKEQKQTQEEEEGTRKQVDDMHKYVTDERSERGLRRSPRKKKKVTRE